MYTSDCWLDSLNLHTKALNRCEYLGNIINYRNCSTCWHTKKCKHCLVTWGWKKHYHSNNNCIESKNYRWIYSIIEISFLNCCVTFAYILIISLCHIILFAKSMYCSYIMKSFRNVSWCSSYSSSVLNLRFQHIFLNSSCEYEQERKKNKKHNGKSLILKPYNSNYTYYLTGISKHTDNSWCKQILNCISITNKSWNNSSRFLTCKTTCCKTAVLIHQRTS